MSRPECWQVNLQTHLGGGEVYTAFLCQALDRLGVTTRLFHHSNATFWRRLNIPASTIFHPLNDVTHLPVALPKERGWLLSHGRLPSELAQKLSTDRHLLTAIAHMPPQGRRSDRYEHFHHVFGVSGYVIDGLRQIGVPVWPSPLYGVADLQRGGASEDIVQKSCYDWDERKVRDRLFGLIEPWVEPFRSRPRFERREGTTLGIVSRLTPIKQFPQLLEIIAPHIAARPNVNLEVFGAGGYASVRDLRDATRLLGERVRFWGHQINVAGIYRQLDFLLTGLPEKEALGLNVIEAQACGLPVLGIDAPPFTETVLHGKTGLLYTDPRLDRGKDFAKVTEDIVRQPFHIGDDATVRDHLALFSEEAFTQRIADVVAHFLSSL